MAKTFNNLKNIKNVDLIIEVVDARAIKTSHNDELINLFHQPKITIALKADLADSSINNNENILIGSTTNKQFKNTIIRKIDTILQKRTKLLKAKGLLIPKFHILVVGLPNVGKSSLINFLNPRKNLKIENRPGVTRINELIHITPYYYLYDTPGVFIKKVEELSQGYILSLVGTIKDTVVPLADIVE
jgi:ribosome biogenesis GTPase A